MSFPKGGRLSPEARAKISAALMGHKVSDETRARMSAAQMGNKKALGYRHSEETRARLSELKRGNTNMLGRHLTPEWRAKLSQAMQGKQNAKGHIRSAEHRARLAEAMRGKDNWSLATIKGECVYCGKPARTIDHVVPGGPDTVPACGRCNSSKGHRTPLEWLEAGLYATETGETEVAA